MQKIVKIQKENSINASRVMPIFTEEFKFTVRKYNLESFRYH